MSDGVSIGVEQYAVPPDRPTALDLAADDPELLVDAVHRAESNDTHGQRWPRSKLHDDKALVALRVDHAVT